MTIDRNGKVGSEQGAILPDDLLKARDRIAQHRARALRSIRRQQGHRRFLPAAVVGSLLLVTAGLADRFVQAAVRSTSASSAVPPSTVTIPNTTNLKSLASVSKILAADQRAIAALAQAQSRLANSAGQDGGGSVALPSIQLPNLPSIPSIPSVPAPAATPTAPPATHATTGASVVVP